MSESALLTSPLELTNEPYAIAKIADIKMCESYNRQYAISHGVDYRSDMPTKLYGIGDNDHPEHSRVIPALIRRFHEAKPSQATAVTIWGSGTALLLLGWHEFGGGYEGGGNGEAVAQSQKAGYDWA